MLFCLLCIVPTLASKPIISPLRSRKSTQYAVDYGSRPSVPPREEFRLPKLEGELIKILANTSSSPSPFSRPQPHHDRCLTLLQR